MRVARIFTVLSFFGLGGCAIPNHRVPPPSSATPIISCPDDKELQLAALHVIALDLNHGPSALTFELGHGSEPELNAQQNRINDYRARVAAMVDPCMRAAYLYWIDFWQNENDEARQEMITGTRRRTWLEYQERQKSEREAISKRAETIPKP